MSKQRSSCRSCCRNQKVRRNGRRSLAEVPASRTSQQDDFSVSLSSNPDFGIVCVDDSHDIDFEHAQLHSVDPFESVKIESNPGCSRLVSAKPNAMVNLSNKRYKGNVLHRSSEKHSSPLVLGPTIICGDTSGQSITNEHDPLQLDDIKESIKRFELDINTLHSPLQMPISRQRTSSVSSSISHTSSNGEFVGDPLAYDKIDIKDDFVIKSGIRYAAQCNTLTNKEMGRTVAPSQSASCSSPGNRRVAVSHKSSRNIPSGSQPEVAPTPQDKTKNRKCPICCNLVNSTHFLEHIKFHELSTAINTLRPQSLDTTVRTLNTLSCEKCSFTFSNRKDLTKHLKQHEEEKSKEGLPMELHLVHSSQPVPNSTSVNLMSVTSSEAIRSNNERLITTGNNGCIGSQQTYPTSSAQEPTQVNFVKDTLITSDSLACSEQGGISRVPFAVDQLPSCQDLDSLDSYPSQMSIFNRNCGISHPANVTYTQNPATIVPSQTCGVNKQNGVYKSGHNYPFHQSDIACSTFLNNSSQKVGANQGSSTFQLTSYPSAVRSTNRTFQNRHANVDFLGSAIRQPTVVLQPMNQQSSEALCQQNSLRDRQADVIFTSDGTVNEIHTLRHSSTTEVSALDSSEQCATNQNVSRRSLEKVIPNTPVFPSPPLLSRAQNETSHHQQPTKQILVTPPPPLASQTAASACLQLARKPFTHLDNLPPRGNALPPADLFSNELRQNDIRRSSFESHQTSHRSKSPLQRSTNHLQSFDVNQVRTVPSIQIPASTMPEFPNSLPAYHAQAIITGRKDGLIETRAHQTFGQSFLQLSANHVQSLDDDNARSVPIRPASGGSKALASVTSDQLQVSTVRQTDPLVDTNAKGLKPTPRQLEDHPSTMSLASAAKTGPTTSKFVDSPLQAQIQAVQAVEDFTPHVEIRDNNQPLSSQTSLQVCDKGLLTFPGLLRSSQSVETSNPSAASKPSSSHPPTDSIRPSFGTTASPLDQPSSSRANIQKPTSIAMVDLASSDGDSSDVDDSEPRTSQRKQPFRIKLGSWSEPGATIGVDPAYVPPSRVKLLPTKTPFSVLDAIPSYQPWSRNNVVTKDPNGVDLRPEKDCLVCFRKFDNHDLLTEHRRKTLESCQCCRCNVKLSNVNTLKKHMCTHTKPYKCEECGKLFVAKDVYTWHFLMHRGDFQYKCNRCDQGFNDYGLYEGHVNKHLNIMPFKCLECNIAFPSKDLLFKHRVHKHKLKELVKCTVCDKVIIKANIRIHMAIHEESAKFLCDQCGRAFNEKQSLRIHLGKHAEHRPHVCEHCGASFVLPSHLKTHARKHTGERPFMCDVCGKTFSFNTPLLYHKRIHTGERPYKCEFCGMTFAQPSPFAVHKRLHTGECPYSCEICAKAFPSHAALRNHMQTHANASKRKGRKRAATNEGKAPPADKRKKVRSKDDSCSSPSDTENEEMEKEDEKNVPPQSRRRSKRVTKCTKSLAEEEE